jgi:hypothetical protein
MSMQKATKAVIQLGETSISVYRIDSSGIYCLSRSQITFVINKSNFRYTELSRLKGGEILLQQEPQGGQKIYIEGVAPFESVTLEQAATFWALELSMGNQKALELVVAITAESLERRADKAFGVEAIEIHKIAYGNRYFLVQSK